MSDPRIILLTIGDIRRDARFGEYSKRQLEYAIETLNIRPYGRVGIIRVFHPEQLPAIEKALRRTSRMHKPENEQGKK